MGRASTGSKEKLIKTGEKLAKEKGLGGFSVRELCLKSKVNLGMFHYHFGTKDKFDQVIMSNLYANMLNKINDMVKEGEPPRANIRAALLALYDFASENKVMLSSLAGDIFGGNEKIIKFISSNFTAHVRIIYAEFEKADKKKQLNLEPMHAMQVAVMPFIIPNLLLGLSERVNDAVLNKLKVQFVGFKFNLNSVRRIDKTLDLIFKGNK